MRNWERNSTQWAGSIVKLVKYLGVKYMNPPSILDELIFPTGKAFLHFNSERQTRSDRIAALAIGLIVGIVTAVASVFLTAKL